MLSTTYGIWLMYILVHFLAAHVKSILVILGAAM